MSSLVHVAIHASQFPEKVRADLVESLRSRAVNHKFHYDSVKQTQKWLALHQVHSPSRNDADGAAIYDRSFEAAAKKIDAKQVLLIGLGCGGGQKDTRLLRLLKERDKQVFYTPCDVSTAMVLTARQTALAVVPEKNCFPLVCDLAGVNDLSAAFARNAEHKSRNTKHGSPRQSAAEAGTRLLTFFGMIPNFEPETILPKLASLVRNDDTLLFSANLSPGNDYEAGVKKILPQYDNALTRDWLLAFLFDLGVEPRDGELRFEIENVNSLKRIVARFYFTQSCAIAFENERFEFHPGESIRLFFSYRYTPDLVRKTLERHGLAILDQWIAKSEEDGVFLCSRSRSAA